MRACHLRDGAALAEALSELEEDLRAGRRVDERDLDRRVTGWREALSPGLFLGPSFDTIAGVDQHGAIIHYRRDDDLTYLT